MINNEWEQIGDELRQTVWDAVETGDFSHLSQNISHTIGHAMDTVSRSILNGGRPQGRSSQYGQYRQTDSQYNRSAGQQSACSQQAAQQYDSQQSAYSQYNVYNPQRNRLYTRGTGTEVGGILLLLFGGGGTLIFALFLLLGIYFWFPPSIFVCFGIATLACALAAGAGIHMLGMMGRFRKYIRVIQNREYCEVKELAQQTRRSVKKVVKDLEKMISKNWFYQGYLDESRTCLMVTDKARMQYLTLMEQTRLQKAEEAERQKTEEAKRQQAAEKMKQEYADLSPEVQKIVEAGDAYVRRIRALNDAIPGEEISAKISRMEMLLDRIFDRVEQHPESADDLRRLMDYYLPMTVKLLEAYAEMDSQPVARDNIISSKQEIEKTLDTLNTAFEKLLDDLFLDTAWDLSSDISVLHTLLAQDGLAHDDLKQNTSTQNSSR